MEPNDERLESLRPWLMQSLNMSQEKWQEFVSSKKNLTALNGFFNTKEALNLYAWSSEASGSGMSLDFPPDGGKVTCLAKLQKGMVGNDNVADGLLMEEIHAERVFAFISALTQDVVCPLLANPANQHGWAPGAAEETLVLMERLKNRALVMKARKDGWTFLPLPKQLQEHQERKPFDVKLLHACEALTVEWAGLVSDLLRQHPARPLLEGLQPQPNEEFNFWNNRLKNLLQILQQMASEDAQQAAGLLASAEGAYSAILKDMHAQAEKGLEEAQDATDKLQPLQREVEELQQLEYSQLRDNMGAVMDQVHQVWIKSRFHCRPCWIVVLLQEICNLFIERSRTFLNGPGVMRGLLLDPAQVMEDVRVVTLTLQTLKDKYIHHRMLLEQEAGGSHRWEFPSHLVFSRLDEFMIRLQIIQEVYRVRVQIQLENVVMAGGRGRMWTAAVKGVCQDFLQELQTLADCQCDASEPADQSFPVLAASFQEQVSHLEARLVSILRGRLDECRLPSAAVKVLAIFGPLLQRASIRERLRPQLSWVVDMVMRELERVHALVRSKSEKDVTSRFFSSPAITLKWTQQVMLRAHNILQNFQTVQHLCVESCDKVRLSFQKIANQLMDIRKSVVGEWSQKLDRDTGALLQIPLVQEEQKILSIPCREKVEALLAELKHAHWQKDLELNPQTAEILQNRRDIGKSYLSLCSIVSLYNQIVEKGIPVEFPLIQDGLEEQRRSLLALQNKAWTSNGIHELMEQTRQNLTTFFASVNEARDNMDAIVAITEDWVGLTLLNITDGFLERGGATEESYARLCDDGTEVIRLVKENAALYGVRDQSSAMWSAYVEHVDQLVQDAILQMLLEALNFLSQNMTPMNLRGALLQVSLQLQPTGSVFEPAVPGDLKAVLKLFIADVRAAAAMPQRICADRLENYQEVLKDNSKLTALEDEVMHHLEEVTTEAELRKTELDCFSPLWMSPKRGVLKEFLTYGRRLEDGEEDVDESPPTLADFQREIYALQNQMTKVNELEDYDLVHGWLQVDLQPFKDALRLFINNWISLYTQHLLKLVRHSMSRRSVDEDDEEAEKASARSLPLTETIMLLETVNVEVPEITSLLQTGGHLVAGTEHQIGAR
ncbi:dynein axonemal heavy chain 17-like isoform X1 [Stigmatopora argus]